nr:uncharacterized protein LOC108128426 [Drosophila bipectinata]
MSLLKWTTFTFVLFLFLKCFSEGKIGPLILHKGRSLPISEYFDRNSTHSAVVGDKSWSMIGDASECLVGCLKIPAILCMVIAGVMHPLWMQRCRQHFSTHKALEPNGQNNEHSIEKQDPLAQRNHEPSQVKLCDMGL